MRVSKNRVELQTEILKLKDKIEDLNDFNSMLVGGLAILTIITVALVLVHILPPIIAWSMTLSPIDTAYISGIVMAFMIWLAIKCLLMANDIVGIRG